MIKEEQRYFNFGIFSSTFRKSKKKFCWVFYRPDGFSFLHITKARGKYHYAKHVNFFGWSAKEVNDNVLNNATVYSYEWTPTKKTRITMHIKKFHVR